MKFDVKEFRAFCSDLQIDSKEMGVITLGDVLLDSQIYVIEQIAQGLNEDCHYFVILKARQLGITTITLALDLYWNYKWDGVQGTLITDTDDNRIMFRETLTMYMDGLPNKWKKATVTHNRVQLTFQNRSRLLYQVAGTKKKEKGGVGIGKGTMFAHGTECSNWGDDNVLADLEASLAQLNPKRLYIWESTARGPNGFQEMWETAQRSSSQRAIFVGWWRNNLYRCKKGSSEFNVYWNGRMTPEERQWVREVKSLYGYEIDEEQMAWWRWMLAEKMHEETKMMQNYPPTEDYAFVMTGSQFFTSQALSDRLKIARGKTFDSYRFVAGETFADLELIDARKETATLKIWHHPKPNAFYVLGCDPAYGSSEWADRFAIQVFRCFADGMEQCAEFCTDQCNTDQFAWITLYLAGAYHQSMINLEINGPGMAVWNEMQSMKRIAPTMPKGMNAQIFDVIANVQNYLYRRPDSISGGWNYHTKTTTAEKERFMNAFKDGFERGIITVSSTECLAEMKNVRREDGELGAPGRGKDDRAIAAGLASTAWKDFLQLRLAMAGATRAKADDHASPLGGPKAPLARNVENYLKAMKVPLIGKSPPVH